MKQAPSGPARLSVLLAATLLGLAAGRAGAQDGDLAIGYEFATWMGSGLYRIGGRNVWNLVLPIERELREPMDGRPGISLLLPVTIGWLDTGKVSGNDLQTFTLAPGMELVYKPTPRWTLRPFAQLGIGKDLSTGENSWVYAGGIRTRFQTDLQDYTLLLGNALVAAGSQSSSNDSSFGRFDVGVGVEHPLSWQLAGRATKLSVFYVASFFSDNASFATSLSSDRFALGAANQLGIALGVERPFRVLGIELNWLGISYVTGDNIEGVRLNTGFPF